METIELGKKVKDKVTGFTGIAVTKCEYLNGCIQYEVAAPVDKDGKKTDTIWVDEVQMEVINDGVLVNFSILEKREARPGGGFRSHPGD